MFDNRFHKFAVEHLKMTAKIFGSSRWRFYPESCQSKKAGDFVRKIDPENPQYGLGNLLSDILWDWYHFGTCFWHQSYQQDRPVFKRLYPGTTSIHPQQVFYQDLVTKAQMVFDPSELVSLPWTGLEIPAPAFLIQDIMIALANYWGWKMVAPRWDLSRKIARHFATQDRMSFPASYLFNDLSPNNTAIVSLEDVTHQLQYESWLNEVIIHSLKEIFAYSSPAGLRSPSARKLERKYSVQPQSEYLIVMGNALTEGLTQLSDLDGVNNINFEFL